MYLHLSNVERDALYTILLEKQVELLNRCEELLNDKSFNVNAYRDSDFCARLVDKLIEHIEIDVRQQ